MTRFRRTVRVAAVLTCLAGCERSSRVPLPESTAAFRPAGAAPAAPASQSDWDQQLGPVLLVQGSAPSEATVVREAPSAGTADTVSTAEAVAIRSRPAILLGRGSAVQIGLLQQVAGSTSRQCTGWPLWEISAGDSSGSLGPWVIGFAADRSDVAEPVPMESIDSLPAVDSSRLTAAATRLASAAPSGTTDLFRGLPFTVTSLWRFRAAAGVEGVAATLRRQINQEARPLEENTFLVAERDSTHRDAPYELSYHQRSSGNEETIATVEILSAFHRRASDQPSIVLSTDYGSGTAFSVIQRDGPAHWSARWASPRGKC